MIEEPPFSQSRSRIRDQKMIPSPSKSPNSAKETKSRLAISPESNISANNSSDIDFIEKTDLKKLKTLLSKNEKQRNLNNEEDNSKIKEKEIVKKIIYKFMKMKNFPVNSPELITKLLQILQIIFRSISDKIFQEENTISGQNSQDVKMVIGIQCPICQKLFKSSYFIDKHIMNKHPQHSFFWQNLKSPVPLFDYQKLSATNQNDEIERVLKKIHKDLRKQRRNSSVSIENRIIDVEERMQDLGIISQQRRLPYPKTSENPHHSRRHSSNSINITSLHQNETKAKKSNDSDYDENSKGRSYRRRVNSTAKTDEYEYDEQPIKSARVEQPFSVHKPQQSSNQTPSSARAPISPTVPQSPSTNKQQNVRLQASSSVPNTPSKIPKIPSKPFIPNLQLQAIKSQGQLPQPQLQTQPQSEPKPKPKPQKPIQLNTLNADQIHDENDVNISFPPESRKTPQSSRATPLRRPLPRKKPASINVPSVALDDTNKTASLNVDNFDSPSKVNKNVDLDDLNFATSSYKQPSSARANSGANTGFPPKKPQESTPHTKRAIPFPSPKKSQTPNHSMSPFTMIQVHSDEEEDNDNNNNVNANNNENDSDSDELSDEVHIQISSQKTVKNDVEIKPNVEQKIEKKPEKNDGLNTKQLPASSPVSIGISKITHKAVNDILIDDEDEVPIEYLDSVSSFESESVDRSEIDFKPKKQSASTQNSTNNNDSRRKKRRNNDSNSAKK